MLNATVDNNLNAVRSLLNADFEFVQDENQPIDNAWKNFFEMEGDAKTTADEIILILLKANSKLPVEFEFEQASLNVQQFVELCEDLHKKAEDDDFEGLELQLELYPNLQYFYNRWNESLMANALKLQKLKIKNFLCKGITIGAHEDLSECYGNIPRMESRNLRLTHTDNAERDPKNHINILKSKTSIGNNDKFARKRWSNVDEAFNSLNNNDFCSKILQICALFEALHITFDFVNESTYYLDPSSSLNSLGITYATGNIRVGAKYLKDEKKKFDVFGVLAHELCHLAVRITFMNNNFDPFIVGESDEKKRFIEKVMTECKANENFSSVISNVFVCYPPDFQASEIIVTTVQMLMIYQEDPLKIEETKTNFKELFEYAEEVVKPEMEKAIPKLKHLFDENKKISYNDLTRPMKAKISHSEINFQGVETMFCQLINEDVEILSSLTSSEIREILVFNGTISISQLCDTNLKYGFIKKTFQINSQNPNISKIEEFTFEQLKLNMLDKKIILLADHAGTGKSTCFKQFTNDLKHEKEFMNSWVSFVNLRKQSNIFDQHLVSAGNLQSDEIISILMKTVEAKNEIEQKIFQKLFNEGKVILLFDGVDEVCPKYTNLLMKIFTELKNSDKGNKMWISTRIHYAKTLEDLLQINSFKFAPFKQNELQNYIKNILQAKDVADTNRQNEIIAKIQSTFNIISTHIDNGIESINNPLMVAIISELCIENAIELESANLYNIFALAIRRQVDENLKKIPDYERDPNSAYTKWEIHEILALKVIIGDDFDDNLFSLNDLAIINKWELERQKNIWTKDMIQRYGFVIVTFDSADERSSIDFIHRTYAEFFVADFLLKFMFDSTNGTHEYEIKKTMVVLEGIAKRKSQFSIVRSFMYNYVMKEATKPSVNPKVMELINNKFNNIKLRKANARMNILELESFFEFFENLISDETLKKNILDIKEIALQI